MNIRNIAGIDSVINIDSGINSVEENFFCWM